MTEKKTINRLSTTNPTTLSPRELVVQMLEHLYEMHYAKASMTDQDTSIADSVWSVIQLVREAPDDWDDWDRILSAEVETPLTAAPCPIDLEIDA